MTREEKNEALFAAVKKGDLEAVKKLIASGAQVDAKNNGDSQPLHCAAYSGHLPVVKYLVEERGAQVDGKNNGGRQPLHCAAYSGYLPVVKYLIEERGAGVDAKDNGDWQPLHEAAYSGHLPVVKYLVEERGARVDAKNNAGKTPVELAGSHPATLKFLQGWASPEKAEEMRRASFGKMAAGVIVRQRQLGSLRPKGPAL